MTLARSFQRVMAAFFICSFIASGSVQARPMFSRPPTVQAEEHDLPPVNWIRSRTIDLKHVAIDLRFDWEKEQAIGSTTIRLSPFAAVDRFALDAADMSISSVALGGGKALRYQYDGKADDNNLKITLDRVYKAGEDLTVRIEYATHFVNKAESGTGIGGFGRGLRFIKPSADEPNKPKQIWSQGESEFNRYWFPSYDSPNDFRTSELTATVEKPFTVISNGRLAEMKENPDGSRTFHWVMDQPYSNYLTSIVVGEFTPVEQSAGGTPVLNFGYPSETKQVAATTKNLPATIEFFSSITGVKYPYAKYSQAFVEDFGGGMENISATTQIEEMIRDERELLDEDCESLQAHELAHQWFGDYVTCRDWGQIWLNESFATYLQAMWTEKLKGHEEFLYSDIRGNQNQVLNAWQQGNRRPIVTKYYADKDALFDTYAYPGGGSVLHMLRKQLGDELFLKALNHYLTTNAHQPVSTEEFRIAVEETTGQSMDWFFDEWLYRMGHPIFEITQNYDESAKKLNLNVKQVQTVDLTNAYPQTQYFQAYVDIEIDNRIERVWLKPQAENVFTIDAPVRPKLVNFDYESTLLKEMKFEKPVDDLLYQLRNDKDVLARRWAMGELEKHAASAADRDRIIAALRVSMESDPFWRIRRAALSVIANIYSPDPPAGAERPAAKIDDATVQALTRLTKDQHSLIRGDAIELLGETRDAKFAPLLMPFVSDQSYSVIDQTALALARIKAPNAYETLTKLANTPSWHDRIKIAGMNGLAELGDKRAFETAYKAVNDKTNTRSLRAVATTVIGKTGKGDERAFPLLFEAFKKALDADDFGGIIGNLRSIVSLGDPRGMQVIAPLRTKFKDNPNLSAFVDRVEAQLKAAAKP